MKFLHKILLFVACLCATTSFAQMPANYYNATRDLCGEELRQALHSIISGHTEFEYGQLWGKFYQTDVDASNHIIDIYTDTCNFYAGNDQCGNYSKECDCYNREHTVPQSWFGDSTPMRTDLFHVYPTDGWANNKRGNLPLATVSNPTYTSSNGSKVGQSTYPGYSGQAFEPADESKGDLARTYFYMSVCYMDKNLGQTSESMFSGSQLKPWALQMLIQWHYADPVSQKEIDRNNAIYTIQRNRNPFIDCPYFVDAIWHDHCDFESCLGPDAGTNIAQTTAKLSAYPIPSADLVNISCEQPMVSVSVFNILGKKTFYCETDANFATINIEQYESGIYFVKATFADGSSTTTKIIKY